jgi:hypothetical protein
VLVGGLEYAAGGISGFLISDLVSAKVITMNTQAFKDNPSLWWAIPGVKALAAIGLLFGITKVKNADAKRFLTGFDIGIWADIGDDLITAFGVDKSLGIDRDIEIVIMAA